MERYTYREHGKCWLRSWPCDLQGLAVDKFTEYEDLGFTPEELKLILNPPEEIYVIDESTVKEYVIDEDMVISIAGKNTFWNCHDTYENYIEQSVSGLHEDYFTDKAEAEAKLAEMEGKQCVSIAREEMW